MDAPAAGRRGPLVCGRRPVRRDACAPAPPAPYRGHRPAPAAEPTAARQSTALAPARLAPTKDLGYPAFSSGETECLPERHCWTREVMPPSDDHQQATTRVPPTVIT